MKAGSTAGISSPVVLFDNHWAPTLAFAHSLGRRGVPLHVYGSGASRWSRYCTRRAPCPPVEDSDQFVPWLQDRVRTGEITRIAPTTDLLAYYVSCLREDFPPEVRRTIAPLTEIETALIKSRFADACTAIGQQVPLTRNPTDIEAAASAARELGYPLFLKPKSHLGVGTAERGCLVHDEGELRRHFNPYIPAKGQAQLAERYPELRWPLLQRYVPSARQRVYSVSGFKDPDHGIVTASLSYKGEQWPPDTGTSTLQVSSPDQDVFVAGLQAVDRLVSRGIFELELLSDNSGLLAIDLNPRAFGFINLDIALGHDLPWLWYRSTLEPVPRQTQAAQAGAMEARHVVLHFLRDLARRRARQSGAARPASQRKAWVPILGNFRDPVPMLLSNARLLRHPRSLLRIFLAFSQSDRRDPDLVLRHREGPQP